MTRIFALLLASAAIGALPACATTETASAGASKAAFQSDRIDVKVVGSGPDVILIHGLSSSRDVWNDTARRVPGYRYHLVQIAGFDGVPPGGNGGDGPLLAPVAEEIARYIREAGLKKPAVVGHSMGGSLTMMVAARHPDLVSKAMVVDMVPFMAAFYGGPAATLESVQPIAVQTRDRMAATSGDALRKVIEPTIAGMVNTASLRPQAVDDAMTSDQGVASRGMYDLITTDLRPELKAMTMPVRVLYVRGPNVPITDAQMDAVYKMQFTNAPHATLVRVPDSAHFIMWDQPEKFASELSAFLKN